MEKESIAMDNGKLISRRFGRGILVLLLLGINMPTAFALPGFRYALDVGSCWVDITKTIQHYTLNASCPLGDEYTDDVGTCQDIDEHSQQRHERQTGYSRSTGTAPAAGVTGTGF